MGAGSSNPGKHYRSSSGPRHSSCKSSWTQAHINGTSRPAAPTNLNVNRALGTALAANNGQRRQLHHHHPTASKAGVSSATTRNAIHQQIHSKPVVLVTKQPVTVVQVNRPHVQRNPARSTKGGGGGGAAKPKIDYRNVECGVCGHTGHSADRCYHRNKSCNICNQPGHLASVCTQTVHHTGSRYRPRTGEH